MDDKDILSILIVLSALIIGFITTTGTKSQFIRLIDIFIIGPIMVYIGYLGYKNKISNEIVYIILMFFGGTTITYNLRNYMHIVKIY